MTGVRAPLPEADRREIARISLIRTTDPAKCAEIEARLQQLDPVKEQE